MRATSGLVAIVGFFAVLTLHSCQQFREGFLPDQKTKPPVTNGSSPKQLLLEVLQTDSGVGGTNQFVYLRVFSDCSVEFHAKRNQDLKRDRVSHEKISPEDKDALLKVLAREDVEGLPGRFPSTYTPIDFNWTLDFLIPRSNEAQKIKVINFYPRMATQNNQPYPEALVRLVC